MNPLLRKAAPDILTDGFDSPGPLAGREEELAWLVSTLRDHARVVLSGPEGMGKTALVGQASLYLQQYYATSVVRLDLQQHRTVAAVGAAFGMAVSGVLKGRADDFRASRSGAGTPSPAKLSPDGKSMEAVLASMRSDLAQLGHWAAGAGRNAVLFVDGSDGLSAPALSHLLPLLQGAMNEHPRLGFVFGETTRPGVSAPVEAWPAAGKDVQRRKLGLVDPTSLAKWIDQKFASAGVVAQGIGQLCTLLGGPRTGEVVELARKTLAVAREVGIATASTVARVFDRWTAEHGEQHAAAWQNLKPGEQRVLQGLAARAQGSPIRVGSVIEGLSWPGAGQNQAESALLKKGMLDQLPTGELFFASATFSRWTQQQQQKEQQPLSRTQTLETTQTRVSFTFEKFARATRTPGARP